MKPMLALMILLLPAFFPPPASAEGGALLLEPVEVTATRSDLTENESPGSVTVITESEIAQKQHRTVEELLRGEFGLDVVSLGPTGSLTAVFTRGANSASTLVMIDGVQVNLNTSGGFNFADLTTDNIEKIEILRGPQSTLWGADAVGGVINIVTKKGRGEPTHSFSFEGGSFATFREAAASAGSIDKFDYSFSVSRTDSGGFSAASENNGNTEDDGYGNTTLSSRLGFEPGADSRAELNLRYTHANFEFDSFGPVDGGDFSNTDTVYLSAPLNKTFAGFWDVRLTPSLAHSRSKSHFDGGFTSEFINHTYTVDLQNNVTINPALTLIFGGEYQEQTGEAKGIFDDTNHNQGYYLSAVARPTERIVLTAGVRHDIPSDFDDETTYRVEGAYRIKETSTRLRAAYATGFRAPTFNDFCFNPSNDCSLLDLNPEEVDSWEAGFDQALFDERVKLSFTYFEADYDELLQFDFATSTVQNISHARSRGVETGLGVRATDDLDLHLKYTWNPTEDEDSGQPLLRRAENKFSATAVHRFRDKLTTLVSLLGRGNTRDFANTLPGFVTVRAALTYQYSKNLKLTVRGENLLNKQYEEATGYGTAGVSAYAGFVYQFN